MSNEEKDIAELTEQIKNSGSVDLYLKRSKKYLSSKKFDEALKDVEMYIEKFPARPWGYYVRGKVLYEKNEIDKSFNDYSKALEIHPKHADSLIDIALIHWKRDKDFVKAISKLETALKHKPTSTMIAKSHLRNCCNAAAEECETLMNEKKISTEKGNYIIGRSKLGLGKVKYAVAYFEMVTKGSGEEEEGEEEEGEEEDEKVKKEREHYVKESLFQLGICQFNMGTRYIAKAIEYFEKVLEKDEKHYESYYNLGLCYEETSNFEEEKKMYLKCVECNPKFLDAYANLGVLYRNQDQNYLKAIEYFDKYAGEKECFDGEVYYNKGLCYYDLQQYAIALKFYRQALEINPKFASCYYNIGCILHSIEKDNKEALNNYNKAIEFYPKFIEAFYNRGTLYWKELKEYKLAFDDLQRGILFAAVRSEKFSILNLLKRQMHTMCAELVEILEKEKEKEFEGVESKKEKGEKLYLLFLCYLKVNRLKDSKGILEILDGSYKEEVKVIERYRNELKKKEEKVEKGEVLGKGYQTPTIKKISSTESPPIYSPGEFPVPEKLLQEIGTPKITPSFLQMEKFFTQNVNTQFEKEFEGELKKELEKYNKEIREKPNDPELYLVRGNCNLDLQKVDEALEDFKKVVEMEKEFHDGYFGMALCYDEKEKYDESVECYLKAIKYNPEFEMGLYNLGIVYTKLGKFEEALKYFQKTAELNSENEMAHYNLGYCFDELHRYKKAIEHYNHAIDLNDSDEDSFFNCATCYRKLKMYEEAILYYTKVVEFNIGNPEPFYLRGLCFLEIKKEESALNDFNKTLKLEKDFKMEDFVIEFMKKE